MKNTALTQIHIALGAKMVPFAGYNMPVQYEGLIAEHHAVRQALGVFDVSHMGEVFVEGPEAEALIQSLTSNDVTKLFDGKVQYSCLPNTEGGIVDDLLVYRYHAEKFLLVVNASNIEKDYNWISSRNTYDCTVIDKSEDYSLLAVQGPKAIEAMQSLTEVNLASMEYYTFQVGTFAGIENVIISATGYTGAGGFELYCANADAEKLWNAVLEAGQPFGLKPCGLGARDTLRLEKGFCLYGNDIDDTTSPLEAGLGWITKLNTNFTNVDYLRKQKESGLQRKLVGFEMIDRGIPRHDYAILNAEGHNIGKVTSGTQSPSLGKAIGMGYVTLENASLDTEIYVEIRGKSLKAKVVKIPFL